MKSIIIKSPAKINLGLRILNKREDGYHNIHTLFYPLYDLYDEIKIVKSNRYSLISNLPAEIIDKTNLITQAKVLLENFTKEKLDCTITLNKRIPIGAGLGGGSSNAAATLLALNELFELNINYEALKKISLQLGSDVSFFLKAKPALGTSRGEELEMVDVEIPFPILLVNPNIHISTKFAFSKIQPSSTLLDYTNLNTDSKDNFISLQKTLVNDFENLIFNEYVEIKNIYNKLISCGALFCRMSGTGATVFGIYETLIEAEAAKNKFPPDYFTFISNN